MRVFDKLKQNLGNIPGWSTSRKIVVFESDDWGSIRMSSLKNREKLISKGFNIQGNAFNMYDALEANDDINALYDILLKHKDSTGRHPVITAVNIVANPDFQKIKSHNYQKYFYEPLTETFKKYPCHDQVENLYKQGIKERLFVPVFHGREHLNVQRWMRSLQNGNQSVLTTFEYGVTAIGFGLNKEFIGDFQAAFDLDTEHDLLYMKSILTEGLDLFESLWGYKSTYFVTTNGPFNNSLEKVLAEKGVKYILGERIQKEPLGNGLYKKRIHYIGMSNNMNQLYLTRNARFEPAIKSDSSSQTEIDQCLRSINYAFRWKKPAIISSHRVNYIGSIEEHNRARNLKNLDLLITEIFRLWPDVEFLTSVELGDLIRQERKLI